MKLDLLRDLLLLRLQSHPVRVRGLKPHSEGDERDDEGRTPCGCVD